MRKDCSYSRISALHWLLPLFTFLLFLEPLSARRTLVSEGGDWAYYHEAEAPPADWNTTGFDDSSWKKGVAPFGYGDSRLRTKLPTDGENTPSTTYLRASFHIEDPADWGGLISRYRVDDGYAIYLNGEVITWVNVPSEDLQHDSLARESVEYWPSTSREYRLPDDFTSKYLVKGKNVVAISVHQYRKGSSDMLFDLSLIALEEGLQEKTVFPKGAEWNYLDTASAPDDLWKTPEFDDSNWKSGEGPLGYGDNHIETELSYGDDEDNKPMTTWFRKNFTVDPAHKPTALLISLLRDDGAAIYLNGKEIIRNNMPAGYLDSRTPARFTAESHVEHLYHDDILPASVVVPGKNIIAVEVHQIGSDSSDLAFDLELKMEYIARDADDIPPIGPSGTPQKANFVNVRDSNSLEKATRFDWAHSAPRYLETAIKNHQSGKLSPAVLAFYASRWSDAFANDASDLDPTLMAFLVSAGQAGNSQEFFDLLSPLDEHEEVFAIINRAFKEEKEAFMAAPKLALAIALVYDQEPPRGWPHYQVSSTILPRKLPDPVAALKFWQSSDAAGKLLHPLKDLSIEELKYVVDTPADFKELAEAQKLRVKLSDIKSLYSGIHYIMARAEQNIYDWPHQSYALTDIKEHGGICVDQAYYASQVAKAHGIPSMVVSGAGNNGNHAWIGYLDRRNQWDFSVGRYEDSKFVTGITYDPQTWEQPTDHEIALMSERFQRRSDYRISRIHGLFAAEYLKRKEFDLAVAAAEKAITKEVLNHEAWETLIKAKRALKTPPEEMDELFNKGSSSFRKFADLEAGFLRRLSTSLENQGNTEEAEKLRARIISRNRRERPDLALEEAKVELLDLMEGEDISAQLALYKRHLSRLKEAGLIAYYAITEPFLEHLALEEQYEAAEEALDYSRRRFEVEEGSQLEENLNDWAKRLAEQ